MTVRGKFRVEEVTALWWSKTALRIKLSAVMDAGTPENKRYATATPSGTIEMIVDNPPASAELVLGNMFYVDFIAVE